MRVFSSRWAAASRTIALCALLFTLCVSAEAQQPGKMPKVGFVQARMSPTTTGFDPLANAFRKGLQNLGYVEGKNIIIEHRYAEGIEASLPVIIAELVRLNVAVLVAPSLPAIRAAKQATTTIPIVIVTTFDPVAAGIVNSFAHPGGNITGLTRLTRGLSGKRLELLKEAISGISRIGVIEDGSRQTNTAFKDYEAAAPALKLTIQSLEVRSPQPDFDAVFRLAIEKQVNALVTVRDGLTASHARRIADLAIKNRLPSMNEDTPYVEAGGLMSYSANDADQFRRAATYVDKILKGAKPADLPIEQPTKFELVINLKTAKEIRVTIPQKVLARANRVIK